MGEEKRLIGFDELWELITDEDDFICRNCETDAEEECIGATCPVWQKLDVPVSIKLDTTLIKCPSCGKPKPQDEMNGQFCYKCTVDFDVWG